MARSVTCAGHDDRSLPYGYDADQLRLVVESWEHALNVGGEGRQIPPRALPDGHREWPA